MFINWKTILLICQFSLNWSKESMQSVSKYQWHFHRTITNDSTICIGIKPTNTQNNHNKEKQSWRYHISWFQTMLQRYINSNPNSIVVVQKRQILSMEQNRSLRNELTLKWSNNLWQKRQAYTMGKRYTPQQIMLGKLVNYMQND